MIVPREEVSDNGEECDKIGLSHTTFRLQAANCSFHAADDCLHNQLFRKHDLDEQLLEQNPNTETEYLIRGMKARFNQGATGVADGHFWYLIEQHQLSFEIDAAELFAPDLDSDGDGIPNEEDTCHSSDLSLTVVIDGCDSKVKNHLLEDGCTISDRLMTCSDKESNHGKVVSCVAKMTNALKKAGIISGTEKGAIQSCAARASIP